MATDESTSSGAVREQGSVQMSKEEEEEREVCSHADLDSMAKVRERSSHHWEKQRAAGSQKKTKRLLFLFEIIGWKTGHAVMRFVSFQHHPLWIQIATFPVPDLLTLFVDWLRVFSFCFCRSFRFAFFLGAPPRSRLHSPRPSASSSCSSSPQVRPTNQPPHARTMDSGRGEGGREATCVNDSRTSRR